MRSMSASVLPNKRTEFAPRAQIAFRGLMIGCRLIDVALRHGERLVQFGEAREIARGQFQYARGGDQGRFRLQQVGAIDGEEGLSFLHVVAERGKEPDDTALVGREHLHGHVLVEIDTADRLFLDREFALLKRHDLHGVELRVRKLDAVPWAKPLWARWMSYRRAPARPIRASS